MAAIVAEVAATLSLKGMRGMPLLGVVVLTGYAASFVLLALTLRAGKGNGTAYAIWGASGVILTAVGSWAVFAEEITPRMAVGFLLVAVGVAVVEFGADRAQRKRVQAAPVDALDDGTRS